MVLGLLDQQKLIKGQARNSGKALTGPLLQWDQLTGSLASLLAEQGGMSWFLNWGEGRGVSKGGAGGVA